jgi:hypothetical protein
MEASSRQHTARPPTAPAGGEDDERRPEVPVEHINASITAVGRCRVIEYERERMSEQELRTVEAGTEYRGEALRLTTQQRTVDGTIRKAPPFPLSRNNDEREQVQASHSWRALVGERGQTGRSCPVLPPAGRLTRTVGLLERMFPSPELLNESRDIAEGVVDVERAVAKSGCDGADSPVRTNSEAATRIGMPHT